MVQQQKKHDGLDRCMCEERPAVEHRMSVEPEVVHAMGLYQLAEILLSGRFAASRCIIVKHLGGLICCLMPWYSRPVQYCA